MNARRPHPAQRLFVSYARDDEDSAKSLVSALRARGAEVFTPDSVHLGDKWREHMVERFRESDRIVMLLTPRALESDWTVFELGLARGLDKEVLLVTSDPELPFRLPADFSDRQIFSSKEDEDRLELARRILEAHV